MESEFPSELGVLFKNLENKGNPWGQNARNAARLDQGGRLRRAGLRRRGRRRLRRSSTCSGSAAPAPTRTAPRRPPRPSPSCCTAPGVEYVVLGAGRDLHRRLGPPLGQRVPVPELAAAERRDAQRRVRGPRAHRKIVVTCPHCFNTLGREYPQLGGNYEVVHHTQLLNRWCARASSCRSPRPTADRKRHLPRPVLPGPAQQGLRRAARADRRLRARTLTEMPRARRPRASAAAPAAPRMWMEEHHRQARQRRTHRGGARHRRRRRSPPAARSAA